LVTEIGLNGAPLGISTEKSNGGFKIGLHGLYGVQGGYNWQKGRFVLGAEADIQRTQFLGQDPETAFTFVAGGVTNTLRRTTTLPTLGTIRARTGITFFDHRWLFYVTGGLAYGEVATSSVLTVPGFGTARASSQQTKLGWIAGLGIEGGLWKSLSVKLEYLYADLGSIDTSFLGVGPVGLISTRSKVVEQVLRVGLNYRFGGSANHQFQ
jgi:outer membrane immunogenic protein